MLTIGCFGKIQTQTLADIKHNLKAIKNIEDALIVDCLLPGQIRRLGTQANYLTARRPVKTSTLDCRIRGGEYVEYDRANLKTALSIWLPAAHLEDAEAQYYVGSIYEKGFNGTPDYAQAAYWYEKAAKNGVRKADISLALLYEKGLGVEKNNVIALEKYQKGFGGESQKVIFFSQVEGVLAHRKSEVEAMKIDALKNQQQLKELNFELKRERAQKIDATHKKTISVEAHDNAFQKLSVEYLAMQKYKNNKILSLERHLRENLPLPTIELIDPALMLTRGQPIILLGDDTQKSDLIGKVNSPVEIISITLNDKPLVLDQQSLFWVSVPIPSDKNDIHIKVTDSHQREVDLTFSMVKEKGGDQNKAINPNPDKEIKDISQFDFGKYYALIIGNNEYQSYSKLKTAANDARKVEKILREKYGFNTKLLIDAPQFEIVSQLNQYRYDLSENDNLLIYYAGHGENISEENEGFWIPVDGDKNNKKTWISNRSLTEIIETMKSLHVIVIADSCYAGTLSAQGIPRSDLLETSSEKLSWYGVLSETKSRTVLTSGGVSPVYDSLSGGEHSMFAEEFLQVLSENNQVIEGYEIYKKIIINVKRENKILGQTPVYSPMKHAGHEAGEFIFQPKFFSES